MPHMGEQDPGLRMHVSKSYMLQMKLNGSEGKTLTRGGVLVIHLWYQGQCVDCERRGDFGEGERSGTP